MDTSAILVFATNFQIRDTSTHTPLTDPMLLPVMFVGECGTERSLLIYNLLDQAVTVKLYGWAGLSSTFAHELFSVTVPANTKQILTASDQPKLNAPYTALSIQARASVAPTSGGLYVRAVVK